MERQIVDVGIALAEDLLFPGAERRHRAVGAAAGDGLNGRVEHLHELGRLAGDAAVFRGRLRADLPGAVHAAVMPLPRPDTTPPVTNTYFTGIKMVPP